MKLFARAKEGADQKNTVSEGDRVEIKIRGVGRTAGIVEEFDSESIALTLMVGATPETVALDQPDAVLEYTTARGLFRQKGYASFGSGDSRNVRFVGQEEPERVQRRDFVRVDVNITVKVAFKNDPHPVDYDALNVSANGILLAAPPGLGVAMQLGMFVWVTIPLFDGKDPVEVRGSAVRSAPKGAVGIRFDHISEGDQERLAHYVARQEREQRKRGAF
jgi:c-di-GMP-binding flagellar brake protein YcgR